LVDANGSPKSPQSPKSLRSPVKLHPRSVTSRSRDITIATLSATLGFVANPFITPYIGKPQHGETAASEGQRPWDVSQLGDAVMTACVIAVIALVAQQFCGKVTDARETIRRIKAYNPRHRGVTLLHLFRYKVEIWFACRSNAKPFFLLGATALLVMLGAVVYHLMEAEQIPESLWKVWTFVADPGSHADETGTSARIISLACTIGGMLIFALMIGLITEAISEQVDTLRKGKSDVIEMNHTLILGWGHKIMPLLKELCEANASEVETRGVVVILAAHDKELMEEEVRLGVPNTKGTRIICRQGNPILDGSLRKVSVSLARSIILLASDGEGPDESDARVLRTILSLLSFENVLQRDLCLVAELCDIDNRMHVAVVGGERCEVVVAHDVVGRAMVQSACMPQLAPVYDSLLGFDGHEFYMQEWPELIGWAFEEVMTAFCNAVPCGIKRKSQMQLNPAAHEVVQEGDEILVLAEDDDTYSPWDRSDVRPTSFQDELPEYVAEPATAKHVLFLGWRRDIGDMILQLGELVEAQSTLTLMNSIKQAEREETFAWQGRDLSTLEGHLTVVHELGDIRNRGHLKRLHLETFDSILILSEANSEVDTTAAPTSYVDSDANTLATMLLVRNIQASTMLAKSTPRRSVRKDSEDWIRACRQAMETSSKDLMGGSNQKVICEMLDSRTKSLTAAERSAADYIMSHELISKYLAMVSERAEVNEVLAELFQADGNEVHIRDVGKFVAQDEEVSFWDIMRRGRKCEEIVIGYYRNVSSLVSKASGNTDAIVLNPDQKWQKRNWSRNCSCFIVIAEQ